MFGIPKPRVSASSECGTTINQIFSENPKSVIQRHLITHNSILSTFRRVKIESTNGQLLSWAGIKAILNILSSPQSQIQRIKELIFVLERSKLEQIFKYERHNQRFFRIWMEDAARPLRLYPLLWWEKWSLGNARMSKNGDKMIPLLLAYISNSRSTKQQQNPEKTGKNKWACAQDWTNLTLHLARCAQHKLLSPSPRSFHLSFSNPRIWRMVVSFW